MKTLSDVPHPQVQTHIDELLPQDQIHTDRHHHDHNNMTPSGDRDHQDHLTNLPEKIHTEDHHHQHPISFRTVLIHEVYRQVQEENHNPITIDQPLLHQHQHNITHGSLCGSEASLQQT